MVKGKATLSGQVKAYISSLGIQASYQPKEDNAQMAEDPTQLPTKKAFKNYTAMVAWFCYVNEELARVCVKLIEYNRQLRIAKVYARMRVKKKTKWETEDALLLDKKISKLTLIVERLEAKKIALETVTVNYDKKAQALSRDLTRRMGEYERSGRT